MLVAKPQPTVSPDADVIDADDVDQDGIGRAWWVPVAGKMVRAGGARTSLCSTVGARTAPRTPFHRSRDRARYRYYEGSRSGPAVTASQHYLENCSFSRDVMRQSSRAVLRQRSNGVRSCLRV